MRIRVRGIEPALAPWILASFLIAPFINLSPQVAASSIPSSPTGTPTAVADASATPPITATAPASATISATPTLSPSPSPTLPLTHTPSEAASATATPHTDGAPFDTSVVTTNADSGPGSLRAAILAANPGTTITFAAGLGPITLSSGQLEINTSLTIEGPAGSSQTVNGNSSSRVFQVDAGTQVTLANLTIMGGHAPDGAVGQPGAAGSPGSDAGGILNNGNLTVTQSTIMGNSAGNGGSGGTNNNGDGGAGARGGNGGGLVNIGTLVIDNTSIISNTSGAGGQGGNGGYGFFGSYYGGMGGNGGDGGGILNSGTLTISVSTVAGDSAGAGGTGGDSGYGQNFGGGTGGTGGNGGGIATTSSTILTNSTLANNAAGAGGTGGGPGNGGGYGSGGNGGNGGNGGGISTIGTLSMGADTTAGNAAGAAGPPGYNGVSSGTPGSGGGLSIGGGTASSGDSIVATNTASGSPDCTGTLTSQDYNLIGDTTGCTFSAAAHDRTGTNPLLGPLQNNGGSTETELPQMGSPAIDYIPCSGGSDQRGYARPDDSEPRCDIGAAESGSGGTPTPTPTPSPTPSATPSNSGTIPWHPHHSVRISDGLNASVDLADGHLDLHVSDMQLPAQGPDLNMGHTWDSTLAQKNVVTPAGAGWMSSLTPSMGGVLTSTVSYTDNTGAVWSFPYTGNVNALPPYTAYTTPAGQPWQLTTSLNGYTLTNILSNDVLTFSAQGQLGADTDSYGNANALHYSAGLPTSESNSGGRSLSFVFNAGLLHDTESPLWVSGGAGAPASQHVSYGYGGLGGTQLNTETWGAGTSDAVAATFGYSGTQLVAVTTPYTQATHSWIIGYDSQGRVSSITSPMSGTNKTQPGYTPAYLTAFTYIQGQTQVVEGVGTSGTLTTTYKLDSQGQTSAIVDGLGDTTHYVYDSDHNVTKTTDPNQHVTSDYYQYIGPNNSTGQITETVKPPIQPFTFTNSFQSPTTDYRYDPATHDLSETLNNNGNDTVYGYDGHHSVITTTQVIKVINPCDQARRDQGNDPQRQCVNTFQWRAQAQRYDQHGQHIATIDGRAFFPLQTQEGVSPLPLARIDPSQAISYTTNITYTRQGDLAQESTPPIVTTLGTKTTTAPVTTSYGYDADGNKTTTISANGNTTTDGYDHLGRSTSTTLPTVTDWTETQVTPTDTTRYDGEGNAVQQVDALGNPTLSSYDPLGREVSTTDPVSGTSIITYSATNKVSEQDPQGNVTYYGYDSAGRLRQQTDPTKGVTQYAYDNASNTTAITTGNGINAIQLEIRQYDALNEVATDTTSGPSSPVQTTRTSYDLAGHPVEVDYPTGYVTYNTYDPANQLQWVEIDSAPVNGGTIQNAYTDYSYDLAGNQIMTRDSDQRTLTQSFDGANRVTQSVDVTGTLTIANANRYDPDGNTLSTQSTTKEGGGPAQISTDSSAYNQADWTTATTDTLTSTLATAYGYDAAGQQRTKTILGGQTPITSTLDPEDRTTNIAESYGATTPYTTSYLYNLNDLPMVATMPNGTHTRLSYDGSSRLTGITTTMPATSTSYLYGYDSAGRTTGITSTADGATSSQIITHDATGRIGAVTSGGTTAHYTYDTSGNITASGLGVTPFTTTYGYGSVPNEVVTTHLPGTPVTYYHYDSNGDTTSITNGSTINEQLSYDSQARLTTVTSGRSVITLTYNAAGQRARYTVKTGRQISYDAAFSYRGSELGQAVITGSKGSYTDTYLYDPSGNPLELLRQQGKAINRYWYVLDGRGNVTALIDITGAVVDRYTYDAWGALTGSTESVPQRWRYGGMWSDSELGWEWASVREYNPTLKRWLQPDPSHQDGLRTYVYVGDDPVDGSDPSGLTQFPCGYSDNNPIDVSGPIHSTSSLCRVNPQLDQAEHAIYMFLIGDDFSTLTNGHYDPGSLALKGVAIVDLASDATIFVPVGGEIAKGSTKLSFYFVKGLVVHSSEDIGERQAQHLLVRAVKQLRHDASAVCRCFPAGTRVSTAHGSQRIETIRVGDRVLAEDPNTGKVETQRVENTITDPVSPLIAVTLSNDGAITTTADHPFWVDDGKGKNKRGWVEAGHLIAGNHLRTPSGSDAIVTGIRWHVGRAVVYTLTVAHDHTYFVGSARVLVHNACPQVGEPSGGVYVLRDTNGVVMRTGRTKNFITRRLAHQRDPNMGQYVFEPIYRTDNYEEQRGLEDFLYNTYSNAPYNSIRAIGPTNPKIDMYREAARQYLKRLGTGQ